MTLMTIMLVLINLLLLVAIVMYFSPLGTMVRHDRQSPAAEDAKRTVSLFGAIQQLLSEHADSLEHVDHRGTANSDDDLDVCVEELRRTNKAAGDSIDDKTNQLAAVLDKYGAIYRSERQELQSYTQHMHELDQMLAEFEKDAGDSNRLLLRFVREMVEENRQLQNKVSSCKIQVSELITKTAKSERDARTDSLTLLLNRRAWDESLERLKDEYPLSVALICRALPLDQ